MRSHPLQKGLQRALLLLPPCEDTARKWTTMNQVADPRHTLNLLALWLCASRLQTVKNELCCLLATQSLVFSCSSQDGLSHKAYSKLDCKGHGGWRAETVKVTQGAVTRSGRGMHPFYTLSIVQNAVTWPHLNHIGGGGFLGYTVYCMHAQEKKTVVWKTQDTVTATDLFIFLLFLHKILSGKKLLYVVLLMKSWRRCDHPGFCS